MGISGLSRLIADNAPGAMREAGIETFFGRKVAIDASMCIYQFLVAVRAEGNNLVNAEGETTSHLMGMFYRTIRMVEHGIKPIYVFDGKPPTLKSGELAKRLDRRTEAHSQLALATDAGDAEGIEKFNKRTVRATRQHTEDCKMLLKLMGIPVIQAPCEAEAQCAILAKAGLAYAAGSEDMDTVTFGAPVLLRHLTFSEARKMPISEINYESVLVGLGLSKEQFIDLCILMGCDYCDTIKGIGPTRALSLIRQHGSIEKILEHIQEDSNSKFVVPDNWPFAEARVLFTHPDVIEATDPALMSAIKWTAPETEGVVDFMVNKNGFNEKRIRAGLEKLAKLRASGTQGRLDSFFKINPAPVSTIASKKVISQGRSSSAPAAKKARKMAK